MLGRRHGLSWRACLLGISASDPLQPAPSSRAAALARQYSHLAWVFGAALGVRLLVFIYVSPKPAKFYTPDSFGYDQLALNLLRYGVFSASVEPSFAPDIHRTPGYPAMMAAIYSVFGHDPSAVVLTQIVLGSLVAVLTWILAGYLGLSLKGRAIAAAVVAADPVSAMASSQLLTEVLFTIVLLAGVMLLIRALIAGQIGWLVVAALVLGVAALTRPISQFLPLVLAPLVYLGLKRAGKRRAMLTTALFLVISMAVTYSWAYRNGQAAGMWALSDVSEVNLLEYRAREVYAAVRGISQEAARLELAAQARAAQAEGSQTGGDPGWLRRQVALNVLAGHPVETVEMTAKGAARLLLDPGFSTICTVLDRETTSRECFAGEATMNEPGALAQARVAFDRMNWPQRSVLLFGSALLTLIYSGAAIGIWHLLGGPSRLQASVILAVIGYLVLLSVGAEAYSRFRVPTVPLLAVLAAPGLEYLLHQSSKRVMRRTRS